MISPDDLPSGCQTRRVAVPAYDAIVLTGGRGTRLGGVDKANLPLGGRTLLDRALASVSGAAHVVQVGPEVSGGPVAALTWGLPRLRADMVVVLACDMPLLGGTTVQRLVAALDAAEDTDGALLVDAGGQPQYLAAVYRRAALHAAVRRLAADIGEIHGASMRSLLTPLRLTAVPAQPEETVDCDTWDDVDRARALLEDR